MNLTKNKSGFTLLEIIIVIIIVGILASLALPRFFKTVEFSRGQEALANLGTIRQAMDRCYLFSRSYVPCTTFANLDIADPGAVPNAHWTYAWGAPAKDGYTATATRTAVDGGTSADSIAINQAGLKTGAGNFASVQGN